MKTIMYKFADGKVSTVEVSDEFYETYQEIEKAEKLANRKETRRHVSIESLVEVGQEPSITDEYFKDDGSFENMDNEKLQYAISHLLPTQQDLIRRVFFEGQSVSEIAKADGIAVCSVSKKLARIYKKLKNFL